SKFRRLYFRNRRRAALKRKELQPADVACTALIDPRRCLTYTLPASLPLLPPVSGLRRANSLLALWGKEAHGVLRPAQSQDSNSRGSAQSSPRLRAVGRSFA